MVGNTGTLMTMSIVRNKVRNHVNSAMPTTISTTDDTAKEDDIEEKQQQQLQQKPQSSFNRGHKHLSISFRLPKSHSYNDTDTDAYGTGKSRFFTNHFGNKPVSKKSNNMSSNNITAESNEQVMGFARTSGIAVMPSNTWVFPPHAPTPNIYHCLNTEELMAANDNSGFKGFRKQFSGRFKRLVAVKKPEPTPVIPPHLKPQLKTIYVY